MHPELILRPSLPGEMAQRHIRAAARLAGLYCAVQIVYLDQNKWIGLSRAVKRYARGRTKRIWR